MNAITSYEAAKAIGELFGMDLLLFGKVTITLEAGKSVIVELQSKTHVHQIALDPLRALTVSAE